MFDVFKLYGESELLTRQRLMQIRARALRHKAWFKALSKVERAIVSLTIRCVERIRSPKLAKILKIILSKLREAMKSRVKRLMETTGRSLAQRLSRVAQAWGNASAIRWAEDPILVLYLAVMHMNTPRMFQTSSGFC